MENVEVKEEKEVKKPAKKVTKKAKDSGKVKFMEDRNAKRKAAGHKTPAYSKEEIAAYK